MSHRLHSSGMIERFQRVPAFAALFFFSSLPSYGQQIVDVIAQNYRFQPQEVHIQPGDTVRWLNREKRTSHSVVLTESTTTESERFFPNESWQHRFEHPGTYPYHCGPHPEMTGTIVVLAPRPTANCTTARATRERKVLIARDNASVDIVQEYLPTQHLSLRQNLLPEPQYLADGRHALLATRDGWILRLDLQHGRLISEVQLNAAVNGTALSAPSSTQIQLLAVASQKPQALIFIDERLSVIKTLPLIDKSGHSALGILTLQTAKTRNSFLALLAGTPELWEISYNPKAPEIGLGMVHDFQYREGHFVPGYLNPQRSTLPSLARDFVLLESGHEVLTVHGPENELRDEENVQLHVMHLDVRKTAAESIPRFLPNLPDLPWRQVDPQTLSPDPSQSVLRVYKPTLRFLESLPNPSRQTPGAMNSEETCVKKP